MMEIFESQTQPGPVAKSKTLEPLAGNGTRQSTNLTRRTTNLIYDSLWCKHLCCNPGVCNVVTTALFLLTIRSCSNIS